MLSFHSGRIFDHYNLCREVATQFPGGNEMSEVISPRLRSRINLWANAGGGVKLAHLDHIMKNPEFTSELQDDVVGAVPQDDPDYETIVSFYAVVLQFRGLQAQALAEADDVGVSAADAQIDPPMMGTGEIEVPHEGDTSVDQPVSLDVADVHELDVSASVVSSPPVAVDDAPSLAIVPAVDGADGGPQDLPSVMVSDSLLVAVPVEEPDEVVRYVQLTFADGLYGLQVPVGTAQSVVMEMHPFEGESFAHAVELRISGACERYVLIDYKSDPSVRYAVSDNLAVSMVEVDGLAGDDLPDTIPMEVMLFDAAGDEIDFTLCRLESQEKGFKLIFSPVLDQIDSPEQSTEDVPDGFPALTPSTVEAASLAEMGPPTIPVGVAEVVPPPTAPTPEDEDSPVEVEFWSGSDKPQEPVIDNDDPNGESLEDPELMEQHVNVRRTEGKIWGMVALVLAAVVAGVLLVRSYAPDGVKTEVLSPEVASVESSVEGEGTGGLMDTDGEGGSGDESLKADDPSASEAPAQVADVPPPVEAVKPVLDSTEGKVDVPKVAVIPADVVPLLEDSSDETESIPDSVDPSVVVVDPALKSVVPEAVDPVDVKPVVPSRVVEVPRVVRPEIDVAALRKGIVAEAREGMATISDVNELERTLVAQIQAQVLDHASRHPRLFKKADVKLLVDPIAAQLAQLESIVEKGVDVDEAAIADRVLNKAMEGLDGLRLSQRDDGPVIVERMPHRALPHDPREDYRRVPPVADSTDHQAPPGALLTVDSIKYLDDFAGFTPAELTEHVDRHNRLFNTKAYLAAQAAK